MGFWTTEVEAEGAITDWDPKAVKYEGLPDHVDDLPEGQYFIQPRTLFTMEKKRADVLKEQLKAK